MVTIMDDDKKNSRRRSSFGCDWWNLGFDVEHLIDEKPSSCVISLHDSGDYSTEILLYAKIGIHRYNMTHGKNLQLSYIEKYNCHPRPIYSCYYITLVAKDPASGGSLVPFQTQVVEEGFNIKSLACYIGRPKFEPKEKPAERLNREPVDDSYCRDSKLPEWPSENAFYDKSRYYLVKKSDLRKYDWISLYMELAFLKANTKIKNPKLSRLAIVKVAVETDENVEMPKERLKARNATFYIKYKYRPNKGRVGKVHGCKPPRDRIAIVRRTMDKNTGSLTLKFDTRLRKKSSLGGP